MIENDYDFKIDSKLIANYKSVLFYGSNEGAKTDFVKDIKNLKNFEFFFFFEEEIKKNKNILFDNIINNSLFAQKKIIIIYEASDKIFDEINECIIKSADEIRVFIFANILDKKSKLRNLFEKSKKLIVKPLYEDTEKTLIYYLKKHLKEFKGVTPEIFNLIIRNAKLDRKIIQNEIEKIKTLFKDKIINKELLENLLNLKKESNFEEIKNTVVIGDKANLNRLLSSNSFNKEDLFFFLNSLISKFKKIKDLLNNKDKNIETIIDSAKPAIFWKEKPILKKQLNIWSKKNIDKIINILNQTEILAKKNSQIESSVLLNNLLVVICNEATSS